MNDRLGRAGHAGDNPACDREATWQMTDRIWSDICLCNTHAKGAAHFTFTLRRILPVARVVRR